MQIIIILGLLLSGLLNASDRERTIEEQTKTPTGQNFPIGNGLRVTGITITSSKTKVEK